MFTTKQVELINKYDFLKAALNENSKNFVVYMAVLKILAAMLIHLSQIA